MYPTSLAHFTLLYVKLGYTWSIYAIAPSLIFSVLASIDVFKLTSASSTQRVDGVINAGVKLESTVSLISLILSTANNPAPAEPAVPVTSCVFTLLDDLVHPE